MSADGAVRYVRLCPTCGTANAPEVLRCGCSVLLVGVDLVRADALAPPPAADAPEPAAPAVLPVEIEPADRPQAPPADAAALVCPYEDCGQPNPPGATTCVYCNRPLATGHALTPAASGLLRLPSALAGHYRVREVLPARGAEAEILLVKGEDGTTRVAKLYRQGIIPPPEVQQRLARIDPAHRVQVFETGLSDGHAYEVMEYCRHGSLRQQLQAQAMPAAFITEVVRELQMALAAVHAAGVVHRDLKPENVLLRSREPLDLVLTDFSTASAMDATQRFTSIARTLLYAPPESLSGVIDAKADYWSLGMMVLEMATGRHPYQGLSEAVILHHLTTRAVELGGVGDARLRLLVRGLLLRDPKRRWGADEIGRWLDGDTRLEVAEPAPAEGGDAFARPYAVRAEQCNTPQQLAVAFARHWVAGRADIVSGQLLDWFTKVHPDQNVVRLLLQLRYERQLSPDQQLLHFILYLAPGIVPVWQGHSVELPALLAHANQALQGDAGAARWLEQVHEQGVLGIYATAGNAQAAELAQRWSEAVDAFDAAWKRQDALLRADPPAPGAVVRFDELLSGPAGPRRPPLLALHPRLLAAAYDPAWLERLRARVQHELDPLRVLDQRLEALAPVATMSAAELLASEAALPQARANAEQRQREQEAQRARQAEAALQLQRELRTCLAELGAQAQRFGYWLDSSGPLQASLDELGALTARARALGDAGEAASAARRIALRAEPQALRLRRLVEEVIERREANSGWTRSEVGRTALGVFFLVLFLFRAAGVLLLLLAGGGLALWRLGPIMGRVGAVRAIGRALGNGAMGAARSRDPG
ncbi:MAG TPA: serine/threonine-protein kinase [Ottowia sp.]|uniref:serine/threonine-protein kinase n=1 Tax=Ottowia sp. TaxID=1898956 RepID=UPI002BB122F7|nr:serine/threonine-protein kinase [Ottowia sp.]HMN21580.1 serine/threonine-protein kinase [Ottowia sp.]